ncbi:MAG TPA: hypothetical protein VHO28_05445 [Ignavibacteriales bacterium]|nr:hypothetical protein [Ignavibacteriales bacterium]
MATMPFPTTPALCAVAIAYKNQSLIADEVLPYVPVGKQEFKYMKYNLADAFTIPDTRVGRKSAPNEVEFGATEITDSTQDYALDDKIPLYDINNAPENYDPKLRAVEGIMDLIKLDREKRAADLVFSAGAYPTANKTTLSGTSQFSDFTNSDPIGVLNDGLDKCVMRPNVMVLGAAVWSKLRTHPQIIKALYGNTVSTGLASRRQVAELFELEKIFVGQGFLNTAKKGQTPSLSRVWGKNISLIYRNPLADSRGGATFGFTARFGEPVAGEWEDKNIGMRGGFVVRAGESVKELVTASDLGYFIQNAVA